MKKKWKVLIGVLAVLALIGYCSEQSESESAKAKTDQAVDTAKTARTDKTTTENVEKKIKSYWSYNESVDEMTEVTNYFATCQSINEVDFEFPYEGGSHLSLVVRNMGKKNEVLFFISSGQFNSGIDGQTITLKVDNDEPFKINCYNASDGRTDVLFANNAEKLLEKIKQAKTLKVQAEFFQEGNKTFNFNVEGLQWEH